MAVTPPVVPRLMSVSTLETLDRTVLDETQLEAERRQAIVRRLRPDRRTIRAAVRPPIRSISARGAHSVRTPLRCRTER